MFEPGAPVLPDDWRLSLAAWAPVVWADMSRGEVRLDMTTGVGVEWQRCPDCRLDSADRFALLPWVDQLAERARAATRPPDAYLLLMPTGALAGPGAFLPSRWLGTMFGRSGFDVLLADRPVAAMHEIGHFLGLPDRADPHGGRSVLTLMGWIDDPLTPPDPILRVERGWAALRAMPPLAGAFAKTLRPGEVLRLPVGRRDYWIALESLPGAEGAEGWLFEVDRSLRGVPGSFERLHGELWGLREPSLGALPPDRLDDELSLRWQFIPIDARVIVEVSPGPAAPAPGWSGCAVNASGAAGVLSAWLPLLWLLILRWPRSARRPGRRQSETALLEWACCARRAGANRQRRGR